MSYYEWTSSIINLLALIATIFFGFQVYKLSNKANDIAEETFNFQKEMNENKKNLKGCFNHDKIIILEKVDELDENESDFKNSITKSYNKILIVY